MPCKCGWFKNPECQTLVLDCRSPRRTRYRLSLQAGTSIMTKKFRYKRPPLPSPLLHPPSLKLWRTRRRRGNSNNSPVVKLRCHCTRAVENRALQRLFFNDPWWLDIEFLCVFSVTLCRKSEISVPSVKDRSIGGRFVRGGPEGAKILYRLHELPGIHRLDHVAIRPKPVAFPQVPGFTGGSQHYHRYRLERLACGTGLDLAKDFHAADFWHLNIQENHDRLAGWTGRVGAAPMKVVQRFFAIVDDIQLDGDLALGEHSQGQLGVIVVVLDEEDSFDGVSVHKAP